MSTPRTRRTLWTVRPYLRQCTPPAFSATLPPIVQAICELGSGAKYSPYGAAASVIARLRTPGCTTAVREIGSIVRMRLNFARDNRYTRGVAQRQHRGDLRLGLGQHDCGGPLAIQREPVALVRPRLLVGREQRGRRHNRRQLVVDDGVEHR